MTEHGNDRTAPMGTPPPAAGSPSPGSPSAPPVRRLVRDPYTRLGGVASGLAHYFAIDVSLVRLAFVLLVPVSGIGLVVYILAWLVVPRAEYWPPVGSPRHLQSVSTREIGIGLAALVILMALFVNGGAMAHALVPVLLVAGGVWVLRQPGSSAGAQPGPVQPGPFQPGSFQPGPVQPGPASAGGPATGYGLPAAGAGASGLAPSPDQAVGRGPFIAPDAAQPSDTVTDPFADPFGGAPPPIPPPVPQPPPAGGQSPGTPAPRRPRRWLRRILVLLLVGFILFILAVALAVGVLIGSVVHSGFGSVIYRPEAVEDVPTTVRHGAGEVELDLTELTVEDFGDDIVRVDVELDVGEFRVVVPEDLPVIVDARADIGDVEVFGQHADGFDPSVEELDDDAVVDLDIRLGIGQVTVEREPATG